MNFDNIILEFVMIFVGASILATIFLYFRQSVILAYITLGILIGPWGLGLIKDSSHIDKIANVGIILLLFLAGLELHPERLHKLFSKLSSVTLLTCLLFAVVSFVFCLSFGFTLWDSFIIGLSLMFSSTVIGLKMLPESKSENKSVAEVMIGVLLLQDILAVLVIMFVRGEAKHHFLVDMPILAGKLALIILFSHLVVKYIIPNLFRKFELVKEYSFILSLGWCLLLAEVAEILGFSHELGAFIAGVSMASLSNAETVSDMLKPLKEFFLVLFFFSVGAKFDFLISGNVIIPGILLGILLLVIKPLGLFFAFRAIKEEKATAVELSTRLGQCSEFSILVALIASELNKISSDGSNLIQLVTIFTFIISTYLVSNHLPALKQDPVVDKNYTKV